MTTALFDYQTIIPHPIEDVFALTVALENAQHWHSIFTDVEQLTPNPIGLGSKWKVSYGVGSFTLDITDYQPPNPVAVHINQVIHLCKITQHMAPFRGDYDLGFVTVPGRIIN